MKMNIFPNLVEPIGQGVVAQKSRSYAQIAILIVILLIAIAGMRWLGEYRAQRTIEQPTPASVQSTTPTVQSSISAISTYQYEHQRCENFGYDGVRFEEHIYGQKIVIFVTCTME